MQHPLNEPFPSRQVPLHTEIRDLLPGHVMDVMAAGVDAFALRVMYEIIPPLERGDPARYAWLLLGRDDVGNQYDDGGGAYGLSADGSRTEGVRSVLPLPATTASWLDLFFYAPGDAPPMAPRRVLRLHLPLAA